MVICIDLLFSGYRLLIIGERNTDDTWS